VGSSNETIISTGFDIHPSDIEAVLSQHPDVREAAMIGLPNGSLHDMPLAFVTVRRPTVDASELRRWLNGRLSDEQRVNAVCIVEGMPRDSTGKVRKDVLVALALIDIGAD
jgi:long-chain acyl-CoA synthetase